MAGRTHAYFGCPCWTFGTIARVLGAARPNFVYVPTAMLVKYDPEWTGPLLGDKAWPVQFDLTKLKSVVGEFECTVGLEEGLASVVPHYRKRAERYAADDGVHGLIDRIAREQAGLGQDVH